MQALMPHFITFPVTKI